MGEENYPQWRKELKYSQKKEGKVSSNRWIQIATINEKNEPSVRTVVFRGWLKLNKMLIYSDRRSEKYKDIKENNKVELLWLFSKCKSQYRFKGHAKIIKEDDTMWNNLSPKSKETWFWPHPGHKFMDTDPIKDSIKKIKPNNFLVYEINIHTVELLILGKIIHKRYLWKANDNWNTTRINP